MRFQGLLQLRRFAATAATLRQAATRTQTRTHTTMRTLASSASPQPELTQVSESESHKKGMREGEGKRQLLCPKVNEREGGREGASSYRFSVVSCVRCRCCCCCALGPIAVDLCNALQMVVGQKMYRYVQLCTWMANWRTVGIGVSSHWNRTKLFNICNYYEYRKTKWISTFQLLDRLYITS